ncbi:MAG: multidrug transporter [Ramlibacter sp.]|nr:multidrug transporter [Ramlibacter sp.]
MRSRHSRFLLAPLGRLALGGSFLLVGCAQLPALDASPGPRGADAFAAAKAFQAPAAEWPDDRWWTGYGDPQLDGLIAQALADSPTLAAATARLRQAEAATGVVGSASKPQLSANAAISQEKLSSNYLTPPAQTPQDWNDYGRATLDFRWELDFWGKNRAALAAATSQQEAARAELAQTRLLLSSGIAAAYAELGRLHANRDTAAQSLEIRRKTAGLFGQRLQHGLETRGSVRAADARRAAAEGAVLALDEQLTLQRQRIAALLGAGPDRGLAITVPTLKLDRGFGLPPELAVDLLGRRPDIVAARRRAQAQDSRIAQKKAEFYPNVNLSAFLGVHALGLDLLTRSGSAVGAIGPAISLPIFSGGRLRGELRGAHAGYQEAVANYDQALANALQEVAGAATSQRALGARLDKAQEAVDAATEAHQQASRRYDGGLGTYLEVLTAEDGLLNALDALTNLRSASFSLDIALQRALGGGYRVASR